MKRAAISRPSLHEPDPLVTGADLVAALTKLGFSAIRVYGIASSILRAKDRVERGAEAEEAGFESLRVTTLKRPAQDCRVRRVDKEIMAISSGLWGPTRNSRIPQSKGSPRR